jgi:glutamate dehydrogenase (NAD(P)+)
MVGVADASGALQSEQDIDPRALVEHLREGGDLSDFDRAESISPADLLALDCDVFIPAALGGMLHEQNADSLRCRLIVEGANSPTTPAADEILSDRGVVIVPDVLANAGGVIVSYFEWVQNLQHFRWEESEVNERLGRIIRRAYDDVSERAEQDDTSRRAAAYELGIERVVEAASTRGYIS